MPEVKIKTDFGEVVIPYSNTSELKTGLQDIEKVIQIVNEKVGSIEEKPKVKPGYDDIYTINSDGSVSILKSGGKTDNVGIVLFAYDPKPLKVKFIATSSGVKNAKDSLRRGKYFDKLKHGYYKLNADGLTWFSTVVLPKIRGTKQGD